jgi:type VI protein secretion system component Hcp
MSDSSAGSIQHLLIFEPKKGEKIKGGIELPDYQDAIGIASWTFSTYNTVSQPGSGVSGGKGFCSPIYCTKLLDRSFPTMNQFCLQGKQAERAVFVSLRSNGGSKPLEIARVELENVLVCESTVSADANGLTHTFALTYDRINKEITPLKASGDADAKVGYAHDLRTGAPAAA